MAKKIRFPLVMADEAQVRNLEELREHFDLESVLEYYKNGKLLTWLKDRYFDDEAEAVEALEESAPDFQKRLCEAFGVEFSGEAVDLEEIALRQERLAKLRTFTDDADVIGNIDSVAFDQEELADLLDEGVEKIYLCGENFTVPASKRGVTYVGVNRPKVHLNGKVPKNLEELGIAFFGCETDDLPLKVRVVESAEEKYEDVDDQSYHTDSVSGEIVDLSRNLTWDWNGDWVGLLSKTFYDTLHDSRNDNILETPSYLFSEDGWLYNKRTQKSSLIRFKEPYKGTKEGLLGITLKKSFGSPFCNSSDTIFYSFYESDTRKYIIYSFDLNKSEPPKQIFQSDEEPLGLCADANHIAFMVKGMLWSYSIDEDILQKIPLLEAASRISTIYTVPEGLYYSCTGDSYTTKFYEYSSKKTITLFSCPIQFDCFSIDNIYHVEDGKQFYVYEGGDLGRIDYHGKTNTSPKLDMVLSDAMRHYGKADSFHFCYSYDKLIYITKDGIIKALDYKTGNTTELTTNVATPKSVPRLVRIGDWICFDKNDDPAKLCRVNLNAPMQVERVPRYSGDYFETIMRDVPLIEI